MIDAVPMPLVAIGQDERVLSANDLAETLFGHAMTGRHYITVLRQPVLLDCVEAVLKSGNRAQLEIPMRDATRDTTYQAVAAPIRFLGKDAVLLSLEDVGHVQAAGQMRRDFVANVSHELPSPLTALLGFIETLRGPAKEDPNAQERFLKIMAREASRMSRLIQDLLSLSRVESEERMRPTDPIDISNLIVSASMALEPLIAENGITLTIVGADDVLEVPGDADQLLQVLTNLMENAIKYGGDNVRVALILQDRDPALRSSAVRIEVTDNGEGIDALQLPRLTERFYRVDGHRSREVGGTGLGLAIVKHIVNRHRGRLRIKSTKGTGSQFVVVLPREV